MLLIQIKTSIPAKEIVLLNVDIALHNCTLRKMIMT